MKLLNYRNAKMIEIPADRILRITEGADHTPERDYPYSDVTVWRPEEPGSYEVRVVESKPYILKLAEQEKMQYGKDR